VASLPDLLFIALSDGRFGDDRWCLDRRFSLCLGPSPLRSLALRLFSLFFFPSLS
jgi:hypothetical protein